MSLDIVKDYFKTEKEMLDKVSTTTLSVISDYIFDRAENSRIFVFGNGGSGATASHFKCDLEKVVGCGTDKKFDVHCLNDNVYELMAIANDIDYDHVFETQLANKRLNSNDIIVAFSGSGNSKNVINAVIYAKKHLCTVIGFTGYDGGKLKQLSDLSFHVPINDMQIAEDIHMIATHCIVHDYMNIVRK